MVTVGGIARYGRRWKGHFVVQPSRPLVTYAVHLESDDVFATLPDEPSSQSCRLDSSEG